MEHKRPTVRTALLFSLGITLLLNLLFLIMFLYGRDAVVPNAGIEQRPGFSLNMTLMNALFNFIMSSALYMLNFKLLKLNLPTPAKHLATVAASVLATALLSYTFSNINIFINQIVLHPHRFIYGSMMRDFFIMVLVILSSQLMALSYRQQQTALENKTLLSENMRARYEMLKNQVNPHFLFNTLNTLNSLIATDGCKAQEYVQQLSSVFRYTLQNREVIALHDEIKFAGSYFHLMQIRYGDSLQLKNCINPQFNNYRIVPQSLQMLIENAIKHNTVTSRNPFTITIETGDGHIAVSNPIIPKKDPESGEGIGLANLAERYRLMWNLNITITADNGIFKVTIPLMKGEC